MKDSLRKKIYIVKYYNGQGYILQYAFESKQDAEKYIKSQEEYWKDSDVPNFADDLFIDEVDYYKEEDK